MKSRLGLIVAALILLVGTFGISLFFSEADVALEVVDQDYVKKHTGEPGFILVDVREKDVYDGAYPGFGLPGGHIPGAINFPGSEIKIPGAAAALAKSGLIKNVTVILYCNAGRISQQFAEAMVKDLHFDEDAIKHYKGGIMDWVKNPDNKLEPENHAPGKPDEGNAAAK